MQSLTKYIFNSLNNDFHYHGFGRDGIRYLDNPGTLYFVDNHIKYKDESLYEYFENFISEYPNTNYCAIGKDIEETKQLLNNFNPVGIGEVKIYKKYYDSDNIMREYSDIKFLKELCKLDNNLPIFLHYDITTYNYHALEDIIKSNPNRKFVLCHCGMNEVFNKHMAWDVSRELQSKYSNLWLDVSWVAIEYFENNRKNLSNLDNCRLLLGSDNNSLNQSYCINNLSKYINNTINSKILFNK